MQANKTYSTMVYKPISQQSLV